MTMRIYIRGNVGDLRNAQIYDADTDKQLTDVAKFRLEADAAGVVQAWLVRMHNPDVTVDVVAGPPAVRAGQTFHLVTLDADQRHTHCDTNHIATVHSMVMNDDATLDWHGGKVTSMHDAVSDTDVKQAINPHNELVQSAFRALTATLRQAIINPLVLKLLGPSTGGAVSKPALGPNPFSRTPVTGAPNPANRFTRSLPPKKAASCPECFDTGVTNGWFHPCSKGCTP